MSENGVNSLDVFRHTYNFGWYQPQNYVRNSAEKKRKATQYDSDDEQDGKGMTLTTDKIRRFADVLITYLFGWYQLVFYVEDFCPFFVRLQPVKNTINHHMKDATWYWKHRGQDFE
jgi:hypothetical protein